MSDDIDTRLSAMYHSEQISAYIVSKLPSGQLATGWIEQGLLTKGLPGNLQDKNNHETLVIPIDRFARLAREYEYEVGFGLFILGEQDSNRLKLVTILKSSKTNSFEAIGFKSDCIQTQELFNTISRLLSEKSTAVIDTDPNLDYIEELLSAAADGDVRHLLSLSLPVDKQKTASWIQKLLKSDLKSEAVIAQYGQPHQISSTILLISRWLLGLDIFRKTKNAITTILFTLTSHIVLCLWDSRQNLATFAFVEGVDTERILRKYILPLWHTYEDVTNDKPKSPKVVIEKRGKREQTKPLRRISDSQPPDTQSISILRTRIIELTNRLTKLVFQIGNIKKRTARVIKGTRIQSMSEHSENAIEELRRIEDETKILENISTRLREMEKQIENASFPDRVNSILGSDEIQGIVSKMAALRELIDKIEIEIGQLGSRTTEIESLKFKRQTEK
ncbi:MAG: hypothetical protein E4H14_13385 [Candidatus Thorarchaeota archaeon]|nr:MAG: hypothetical protein E4H14_13385 [Candidatus Thorarchaeota archaeon]